MKRLKKEIGISLAEVIIASALTITIVSGAYFFFAQGRTQEIMTLNNNAKMQLVKQVTELVRNNLFTVSELRFDPQATFVAQGVNSVALPSNSSPTVGNNAYSSKPVWHFPRESENKKKEFPFDADASVSDPANEREIEYFKIGESGVIHNLAHTSTSLEGSRIEFDPTTRMPKRITLFALFSRCIDGHQNPPAQYTTLDQVKNILLRPKLINGEIFCCEGNTDTCPLRSDPDQKFRYFPTIFIVRNNSDLSDPEHPIARPGPTTITQVPSDSERHIVPGAGFFLFFNRDTHPDQLYLKGFLFENKCKMTTVGFGQRAVNKCANTNKGFRNTSGGGDYINFRTDIIKTIILDDVKQTSNDQKGTSYIKIGG